jgi:ABC-type nitrate/sulfonate/bicarbonate transport system permease component
VNLLDEIKKKFGDYAPPIGLILILLLACQGTVVWRKVPEWILPAPSEILKATWQTLPLLMPHVLQTVQEMALGLALALVAGVALAAALDLSPWLRRALYPLLVASQTIPILALAPLLIIWFGFGIMPKVFIVALFGFFPIAVNTADGLSAADPGLLSLLRAMGATRRQIWTKVRLPASLPYFFSGLRISATYSVVGAIIGEWVGASQGLGVYMLRSANAFRTAQVFSAIAISSLLSLTLFVAIFLIERMLLPWYHSTQRATQWEKSKIT